MSRLAEFRALERLIATQQSLLTAIKVDPRLKRELEFESKLQYLLAEYGFGLSNIQAIIDSENANIHLERPQIMPRTHYRARQTKYYRNPYTHEVVEAKSTRHKTLQLWVKRYGRNEVERWASLWF
jgi:hypothetical protein